MIDCKTIRPLVSAYYDGDVTPEEHVQVERHLAGCPECSRVMAQYRAIGSDLRALPVPAPPVGLRRDVWRAIDAQEARPRILPPRSNIIALPQTNQAQRDRKGGSILTGGGAWARALPAALLVGTLLVVMGVLLLMQRNTPTQVAAELEGQFPLTNYGETVYVKFNKQVNSLDATNNTHVRRTDVSSAITLTSGQITKRFLAGANGASGKLAISPIETWQPGADYEIVVDAPNIGLIIGRDKLNSKPIRFQFGADAHTPTPTLTPTDTPVPTQTPVLPTNTPVPPTAVAQDTPLATPPLVTPANTPGGPIVVPSQIATAGKPTATAAGQASASATAPRPTATSVMPTVTPVPPPTSAPPTVTNVPTTPTVMPTLGIVPTVTTAPTRTPQPPTATVPAATATSTVRATQTATATARVTQTPPTATSTVRPGTPTTPTVTQTPAPTHGCDLVPERGFGKIWQANAEVRKRIGCADVREVGIPDAVIQRFEGGVMVWRGDTKTIYVFLGPPSDEYGTWREFRDTWTDTETLPRQQNTPPAGRYVPARGFGKVWSENEAIRQTLGWGIEPEHETGAAWQEFERGYALWTADATSKGEERTIRFLYSDNLWQRFDDTFKDVELQN